MTFWQTVGISVAVVVVMGGGGGFLYHRHVLRKTGLLPKGDAGGSAQVGAAVGGTIPSQTQSAASPAETAAALITTVGATKLQKV
jgi:hypothetical protein